MEKIAYIKVSPFIRVVETTTFHHNGRTIEAYREYRPWVWVVLGLGIVLGLMKFAVEAELARIMLGH